MRGGGAGSSARWRCGTRGAFREEVCSEISEHLSASRVSARRSPRSPRRSDIREESLREEISEISARRSPQAREGTAPRALSLSCCRCIEARSRGRAARPGAGPGPVLGREAQDPWTPNEPSPYPRLRRKSPHRSPYLRVSVSISASMYPSLYLRIHVSISVSPHLCSYPRISAPYMMQSAPHLT